MKKIFRSLLTIFAFSFFLALPARADSVSTDFENYNFGNINGQQGWLKTGPYDSVISNSFSTYQFGQKSLRISDAITSGSFGDQTFSMSLVNEAGESDALNNGMSGGTRMSHFEAQFELASTKPNVSQDGLSLSISPDRGDGARMSYLRFVDSNTGINVFFDDVTGTIGEVDFRETKIATNLSRSPHTFKFVIDFVEGSSNDVVKIYIDGVLAHTGTSWENYYRFDPESNPSLVSNSRTVDSLIFREGGSAHDLNMGNGFLIDNLILFSGNTSEIPTNKDQCKKDGWKVFTNPSFKNQGQCVSYYERIMKNPELIQTLTIPANSTIPTISTNSLEQNVKYLIKVSGVANAGDGIEFDVDYSFRTPTSTLWTDSVSTYESLGDELLDLKVNGFSVNWGTYNSSHEYSYQISGNNQPLSLMVNDVYPSNNTGSFTANIYKLY